MLMRHGASLDHYLLDSKIHVYYPQLTTTVTLSFSPSFQTLYTAQSLHFLIMFSKINQPYSPFITSVSSLQHTKLLIVSYTFIFVLCWKTTFLVIINILAIIFCKERSILESVNRCSFRNQRVVLDPISTKKRYNWEQSSSKMSSLHHPPQKTSETQNVSDNYVRTHCWKITTRKSEPLVHDSFYKNIIKCFWMPFRRKLQTWERN